MDIERLRETLRKTNLIKINKAKAFNKINQII